MRENLNRARDHAAAHQVRRFRPDRLVHSRGRAIMCDRIRAEPEWPLNTLTKDKSWILIPRQPSSIFAMSYEHGFTPTSLKAGTRPVFTMKTRGNGSSFCAPGRRRCLKPDGSASTGPENTAAQAPR